MQHQMRLAKAPFEKIKNGTKTIECRLFDEKRQRISVGDEIVFTRADDSSQVVMTKVVALYRYSTFNDLLNAFEPALFGGDSKEELASEIRQFYSVEDEMKYGVLGIKIQH